MDSTWRSIKVGDIAAKERNALVGGPFGSNLISRDYVDFGVPVVRGQNMGDRYLKGPFAYVTPEKAQHLQANLTRPGDLVFTQRGTIGQVSIVPDDYYPEYLLSQSQMKLTVDPSVADPRFFYYYFTSPQHREYEHQHTIQTGVPHTNLGILRNSPVPLPPLPEQRAIAHILGTLDDKIELNRKMTETLEEMAQALFDDWSRRTISGRMKVADLVASLVLEIGDGYRAKNDELGSPGIPFIRAADLKDGINTEDADRLRNERVEKAGTKIARLGDVAFTSKGTVGRVARVGETVEPFVYSPQVCYWRSLRPEVIHPAVLYCWMRGSDFADQIQSLSAQTDMAPYVSLRDQRGMSMPLFPADQGDMADRLAPLLHRRSLLDHEATTLSHLRDILLPQLLSNELRVSVAEKQLEAAL